MAESHLGEFEKEPLDDSPGFGIGEIGNTREAGCDFRKRNREKNHPYHHRLSRGQLPEQIPGITRSIPSMDPGRSYLPFRIFVVGEGWDDGSKSAVVQIPETP